MTRRFWIGLALAFPSWRSKWARHLLGLDRVVGQALSNWLQLALRDAGRACGPAGHSSSRGWQFDRQPQSQHVHADRHGDGRRLDLQRRRDARAGPLPSRLPRHAWRGRRLFRGGGRDHRARAARPGARAARARIDRRRDPRTARPRAEDRAASQRRWRRRRCPGRWTSPSATACASGPASACRSTASWSKGAVAVDESMVTGESLPVEKEPGARVLGGTSTAPAAS